MVSSPRDFEWIASEPSRNPHLVSASGHKLKHCGEQSMPMKLHDGRKIWIAFLVCEVNGPIMSVGKHVVVSCDTKKLERWWTGFEPTASWNAGSTQET